MFCINLRTETTEHIHIEKDGVELDIYKLTINHTDYEIYMVSTESKKDIAIIEVGRYWNGSKEEKPITIEEFEKTVKAYGLGESLTHIWESVSRKSIKEFDVKQFLGI